MHLQIKASPDDTADNIRRVVNALAQRGINIEAVAPDFDPPHVRVLVQHAAEYDPSNVDDPVNQALAAMEEAGLTPELKSAVLVSMPNKPRALKAALDRLTREGYVVESILVLPSGGSAGTARVSFGVARTTIADWGTEVDALRSSIERDLEALSRA